MSNVKMCPRKMVVQLFDPNVNFFHTCNDTATIPGGYVIDFKATTQLAKTETNLICITFLQNKIVIDSGITLCINASLDSAINYYFALRWITCGKGIALSIGQSKYDRYLYTLEGRPQVKCPKYIEIWTLKQYFRHVKLNLAWRCEQPEYPCLPSTVTFPLGITTF